MYAIGNACMMKQWIIDNVDISTVRRCFKCGVAISAGTGVYISAVDGKIYPYTSTTKDAYVGIAEDSGAPNKFIDVVTHGYLKVPGSGWAAGLVYYVNNGGGLTAGAGDTAAAVGYGEDAIIVYTGKGSDAVIVLGTGNLSSVRKCSNNSSSGACSSVLGFCNTASGAGSSILGGKSNNSCSTYSFVGNGLFNTASGCYASVINGGTNTATGMYSFIGNGANNIATSQYGFIGDGAANSSSGVYGSVVNGQENCATNYYSFVGNGSSNIASGSHAAVVNGSVQQAFGDCSFVGAGYNNTACSCTSVVLAGCQNQLFSSSYGVINNGIYNVLCNSAGEGAALYAFIGNGTGNNTTGGIYSNCNWAGGLPTLCNAGCYSFIGNGFQNRTPSLNATVLNGCCNVSATQNATILNGFCNSTVTEEYQFIGNGFCNYAGLRYASIINGLCNTVSGRYNTIANGDCNTIVAGALRSFIGSGTSNTINITGFTGHAFIGGGISNCVTARRSNVIGGRQNLASGSVSTIGGGCLNTASAYYTFLGGGFCNVVAGCGSALAGGVLNTAQGVHSFVGAGNYNKVCAGANSSVVGGVGNNTCGGTWSGASFTVAPTICNAGAYSFIGGGFQNATSANYSSVVSGCKNTASGLYSSVLNGFNNVVSGAFSAASGCDLVASCACTFYTNNHCACGSLAASTLTPGSAVCVTAGGTLTNYVPVGAGITLYYGSFYSTVTQTATNPNQEYLMTLNTTTLSNGVTISGSQITIANAGIYNIQFSAQIKHTSGGTASLDIWFKKNGTNIADTNTKVVASNNTEEVAAWNIVESFTAGQYVELAWNSNVGGVQLLAAPAQTGPVRPGIPSVIVTVTRVG